MQHQEEAEEEAWIYNGQEKIPPTVRRVKIAETVRVIPDRAFSITRPQQLFSYHFPEHHGLEEVILSSSVQAIGKSAFFLCRKLKSILYQGQEKEEVGIPSTVKVIDNWAFAECKLTGLGLNEGLERIGEHAFSSCVSLTEVEIPSTVKVIDGWAFNNCNLLARLGLNEGLERIGAKAFCQCDSLTEVDFPSTVKVIDGWAFEICNRLARLCLNEGLERIGRNAFSHCKSLTEVEIPSTVKVIDSFAFGSCKLLARLVLNEGLERIGIFAFNFCDSLTEMNIPSTVKVIDTCAFSRCKRLGRLGMNEGLERIGQCAFSTCDSLSHVRIPQSVNSLATDAFACSSMISIELPEECSLIIDLSQCLSLVSVVGQMSIFFREEFFRSSRLGSLVDDEDELIHRLNHRFDNSPLNKLCYYQSYQSSDERISTIEEHWIRCVYSSEPPTHQMDSLHEMRSDYFAKFVLILLF
eukprot:scaffold2206_cov95-Cylindrotheca_fusiformis.AAC.2